MRKLFSKYAAIVAIQLLVLQSAFITGVAAAEEPLPPDEAFKLKVSVRGSDTNVGAAAVFRTRSPPYRTLRGFKNNSPDYSTRHVHCLKPNAMIAWDAKSAGRPWRRIWRPNSTQPLPRVVTVPRKCLRNVKDGRYCPVTIRW